MFSLESPHRSDSNENTHYTIFNFKKRKSPLIISNQQTGDFYKGLMNEFETAVVNEPSVFESLKFYCMKSFFPCSFTSFTLIVAFSSGR